MLLFLVRHGDPIYEPNMLTPLGQRQAEAVAKRLALYGVDQIYASPSTRAYQTAIPTSQLTKKEIVTLEFTDEVHTWEHFAIRQPDGTTPWCFQMFDMRQVFARQEVVALGDQWYTHPDFAQYPFRQGVERINRETDQFLASLGYVHDRQAGIYRVTRSNDERVALFAHQGFGLSFLSSLLDIPFAQFSLRFDMGHSGMSVVEFREAGGIAIAQLLTLGNDAHLYREGLPTCYQNRLYF